MELDTLQQQTRLVVNQKITMTVNRYTVAVASSDGGPGETVAFAEQSRFKLREEVTFYSDESKQHVLFGFKARQVMDIGATYDVVTPTGEPLGLFRNEAMKSLLSTTWRLEPAGRPPITGSERSTLVAVLRRIQDTIPLPYHFDFTVDGQQVLTVERKFGIRDRYMVEISEPRLDRRLVIAIAVALDALQAR